MNINNRLNLRFFLEKTKKISRSMTDKYFRYSINCKRIVRTDLSPYHDLCSLIKSEGIPHRETRRIRNHKKYKNHTLAIPACLKSSVVLMEYNPVIIPESAAPFCSPTFSSNQIHTDLFHCRYGK